jgi:hypothetical protein
MTKQDECIANLKRQFIKQVVMPYDHKLKGNYFIHEFGPNHPKSEDGMTYENGGRKLAEQGASLVVTAAQFYRQDFEKARGMSFDRISGECLNLQIWSTYELYHSIKKFESALSVNYKQDFGEMVFHQLRLLNMCHLGESDPVHFKQSEPRKKSQHLSEE